ncbi:MAG: RidA family protein [Albidovulum sp.]|nr:RidA family protein [Albidovulum sp.]
MIGRRIYSGSPFESMAGYARAVVEGGLVHVSGTTGYDHDRKGFAPNVEEQAETAFATVREALAEAGTSLENMIRIRVYVATRAEFDRIKPIIKAYCDSARPANTTIICDLVAEEMRVEIEVTARVKSP